MTRLLFIRHAPTVWNASGRLQGRRDVPVSPDGMARARAWCPPADFATATVLASPLSRARQTAALFGKVHIEPALIETDWGAWEGQRLADLRAAEPHAMAVLESRGLDCRAPDGESPRDVMCRLHRLFTDLATRPEPTFLLVAHKGVRRAALALATGWTMESKPPVKLGLEIGLELRLDAAGQLQPDIALHPLVGDDPCAS